MTMTNAEAVEYLKEHQGWYREGVWCREVDEALTLAISALEATGEPVAWASRNPKTGFLAMYDSYTDAAMYDGPDKVVPLYLHPALTAALGADQ